MSSITIICIQAIILIINILFIRLTIAVSQCDLSSAINLQSAAYSSSIILRVQSVHLSNDDETKNIATSRKVLVHEVIKMSITNRHYQQQQQQAIKINDIIIIKINDDDNRLQNDSCWHLLRASTKNMILFLNETNTDEFNLQYPPMESTQRVRQHIDAVLNHETYPPKVLIKTRTEKTVPSKEYFLQCNSRGNPLPRLLWSKIDDKNQTLENYPSTNQCESPCRIYSIQHKYQSILYFRLLTFNDSGTYICRGENAINHTMANIHLKVNGDHRLNESLSCPGLKNCHNRGQCIMINNLWKCLCDDRYFGEQCEIHIDDVIKKKDSETAMLLFQSRFLAGCILFSVGFLLLVIAIVSWSLARNNRQQQNKLKKKLLMKASVEKTLVLPVNETSPSTATNGIIPSSTSSEQIKKPHSPPPSNTSPISHSPILEKKPLIQPFIRQTTMPTTLTRESSTATDDDDDDDGEGLNSFLRYHQMLPPVPTRIDEEYEERFSYKMNKSEELGLGYIAHGSNNRETSFQHSYVDFYQPDSETGLIKPLNLRNDPPQRYTKYVSSYSKFVLPRPVKSSSLEHQQR